MFKKFKLPKSIMGALSNKKELQTVIVLITLLIVVLLAITILSYIKYIVIIGVIVGIGYGAKFLWDKGSKLFN